MTIVDAINRLIGVVIDVFRQVGRGRIWGYLLVYFAACWIVLYAHYDFTSPLFGGLIGAWTNLIDSQRATGFTHYRGHFILLPYFFEWAKLLISIILESLLFGAVAILFYERFVDVDPDDRFRLGQVVRLWGHLVLGLVAINGVILLVNVVLPGILKPLLEYSPRRQMVFQWLGLPLIYAFIVGALFYVIPAVAVYRENILGAVMRSLRVFRRNPGTSVAMAALVLAVPLTISNLANSPYTIVDLFRPELVYYLLLVGLVVDVVVGFFWMGMAVRLLVDQED